MLFKNQAITPKYKQYSKLAKQKLIFSLNIVKSKELPWKKRLKLLRCGNRFRFLQNKNYLYQKKSIEKE
jgi:hypothetical protein